MIVEEEMLQNTADISSAVISASLSGLKRKRTQSITDIHISSSAEDLTVMTVSSDSLEQRIANALLKKCVKNAAAASRIPLKLLKKMPPGQQRRNLVDDITIMVVLFDEGEACDH